ncbi:unnamed protein product [Symbiodinium sp. CCMP2592]|nr:unnamed protein product [Symbiodinium sp. CCMP2592]
MLDAHVPLPKPGKGIPAEWQRQLATLSAFSRPLKPLQRPQLCSGCWRLTANEAKDSGRFCTTCSEQSLVLKSLCRCGGCDKIYPADAGSMDGQTWLCRGCSTGSDPTPGGYPQLAHAQLRSLSAAGIDIEVPGAAAKAHRLPWSLLQPVPKPSIEPGAARAKWSTGVFVDAVFPSSDSSDGLPATLTERVTSHHDENVVHISEQRSESTFLSRIPRLQFVGGVDTASGAFLPCSLEKQFARSVGAVRSVSKPMLLELWFLKLSLSGLAFGDELMISVLLPFMFSASSCMCYVALAC